MAITYETFPAGQGARTIEARSLMQRIADRWVASRMAKVRHEVAERLGMTIQDFDRTYPPARG